MLRPLVLPLLCGLMLAADALAATSQVDPGPSTRGGTVGGEQFVRRDIIDSAQGAMPAVAFFIPEKWQFEGAINWHYGWVENPVERTARAVNPTNAEAYFAYPALELEWVDVPPSLQQYAKHPIPPGQRNPTGRISMKPSPPTQIMALFIKQIRGSAPNFKWVGQQSLPGLAKALKAPAMPNQQGIAVKISYSLNGAPVEEAFYGVYYRASSRGAGPASALEQTNWGVEYLQSFRAPAGQIARRMPVFAAIARSYHIYPAWAKRRDLVIAKLQETFDQKIKAGYQQLAAAQQLAAEVTANAAAFSKQIDAQMVANRQAGSAGSSSSQGRSVFDKADDLYRGVDTTEDPMWGTSQHSFLEQYHWTDGFGDYRNSNDPNYDPNKDEAGSWQLMPTAP